MIVEHNSDRSVTVTMNVTLEVGRRLRISPSQGYMGVDPGYIQITHILTPGDIQAMAGDDDAHDVVSMIESYKDTTLGMCSDRDGNMYEPDYSETLQYLDGTTWIVYTYPHSNNGTDDSLLVFPLEEFLLHTSMF